MFTCLVVGGLASPKVNHTSSGPSETVPKKFFFLYYFGGLECVGQSFDYVAHFVFLRDVWIRTQTAAVASRRATSLVNHLPNLATHLSNLATHLSNKATHLPP